MKAFPVLLLAALLLAPTVHAQETPAAPAPQEPAKAAEPSPAEAPAPAPVDLTPAQDVPLPKQESSLDLMPAQDTTTPAPAALEPALIPETPESIPKPEGSAVEEPKTEKSKEAKEKPDQTAAAANEMSARIRYRQIKTRALKDPAVQAEWQKAELASTDYEKREALKRYYQLLYARMEKLDKSVAKEIETRRPLTVRRLQQNRIDPTEPPKAELRTAGSRRE